MVERSGYVDGEPCWADLVAADLAAAQRFYATLFGWTFLDTGADFGHYVMCLKDGKVVAGMSPPMPGAGQTPAAWSLYLMSHDLEDTARRVDAGGGKIIVAPMDIPSNGRMLFALDPSGAAFGAWEPGQHTGSQLFDEDGALCWAEVNTRDPGAVDSFYQGLFGYRQTRVEADEQFDYTAWSLGNADPVAGRLTMTEAWRASRRTGWSTSPPPTPTAPPTWSGRRAARSSTGRSTPRTAASRSSWTPTAPSSPSSPARTGTGRTSPGHG